MALHVSISEFESIAISNYPNIILKAMADDFEPELFSLIPASEDGNLVDLERAGKFIGAQIKKTSRKREALAGKYAAAIDSAEIILNSLKGGREASAKCAEGGAEEIARLEEMVKKMPSKTKSDMEERMGVIRRIARLSARRAVLYDGLLTPGNENATLEKIRAGAKENYDKTGSGADLLLMEAAGQFLGYRDRDIQGLEALILKARQTRDVIEMAQWRLLDCVEAAIAGEWDQKPGHSVPKLPFSKSLLEKKGVLNMFLKNGADFALALEGPIGTGKSAVAKNISENAGLGPEPAAYAVPSLHSAFFGVPFHDKETGMVRIVPTEDGARLTTTPSCLVFDELLRVGTMGTDMQNMLLRVLLENEVSPGRKLHPLTMKIVTTNNPDDASNPHSIKDWSEALANRVKHYVASVTRDAAQHWLDWAWDNFAPAHAQKGGLNNRDLPQTRVVDVLTFLDVKFNRFGPSGIYSVPKGRELRDDPAFPTFRTWAAVLGGAMTSPLSAPEFADQIVSPLVGTEIAKEFLSFITSTTNLPKLEFLLEKSRNFPYALLPAAADALVSDSGMSYADRKRGGRPFSVESLGKDTIYHMNGGAFEPEETRASFSGKPLIDRMTEPENRESLSRSSAEICSVVQETMNDVWGSTLGAGQGAGAEALLLETIFFHMKKRFEDGEPADGKYISDIIKLMALYPHPESRESMFRSLDRMLITNPDKATMNGLRRFGVNYSPRDEETGEQLFNPENIRKLRADEEEIEAGKPLLAAKLIALFPAVATLELASERWTRGCGRSERIATVRRDGATNAELQP